MGLSNRPYDKHINFDDLAKITEGFTAADIIEDIIESAARDAANLNMELINQKLVENEITRIKPQKIEIPKEDNKGSSYIR